MAIRRALGEDKACEAVGLDRIPGLVAGPLYDQAIRPFRDVAPASACGTALSANPAMAHH
jgi:hypothetical protein